MLEGLGNDCRLIVACLPGTRRLGRLNGGNPCATFRLIPRLIFGNRASRTVIRLIGRSADARKSNSAVLLSLRRRIKSQLTGILATFHMPSPVPPKRCNSEFDK